MLRILSTIAISALCALGLLYAPPTATADPGGFPVCDPNPQNTGIDPVVAPCPNTITPIDAPPTPVCGSAAAVPGGVCTVPEAEMLLPYCAVPYMLLPDTAAVGGKSWQCLANGLNTALDDPVLPYCAAPLVLVPDIAALGGESWQCPVGVGSGPLPPPPPPPPPMPSPPGCSWVGGVRVCS